MKEGYKLIRFVVFWEFVILLGVGLINAGYSRPSIDFPITSPYTEQPEEMGFIPAEYREMVMTIAEEVGVPPEILHSVIRHESEYNPNAVNRYNSNGTFDSGLMQLNSDYIEYFVDKYWHDGHFDVMDPVHNVTVGAKYLKTLEALTGNWELAVKAYNTGYGSVISGRRTEAANRYFNGVLENYIEAKRRSK